MDRDASPKHINAFRGEVRAFLDSALTADMRSAGANQVGVFAPPSATKPWHRALYKQGWITPTWPEAFGGAGWSALHRYVFEQECAFAETPTLPSAGLLMCGPILMHFGTREQQERFLPRMRSGEDYWCQGFSEAGAGSDLAALSCRAARDGDHYVIDGAKLWTTHAHHSDWIFLLVRTSAGEDRRQGITFLLADMKSPGVTVDPIISMSGEHEVNAVFFDSVRVPVANRVGAEGDGWDIAKRLLEFERSGVYAPRTRRLLARIQRLAQDSGAVNDPDFRRRYADISIEVDALEASELRLLSTSDATAAQTSSVLKLAGAEVMQRATELLMLAPGAHALVKFATLPQTDPLYAGACGAAMYLGARAATIYGGSNEIQRNILAKRALGL